MTTMTIRQETYHGVCIVVSPLGRDRRRTERLPSAEFRIEFRTA